LAQGPVAAWDVILELKLNRDDDVFRRFYALENHISSGSDVYFGLSDKEKE